MRIIQTGTVYAMRILGYMYASKNDVITVKEFSEELGISHLYLMKIMNHLKHQGIVMSTRGCHGGFYLNKKLWDVTVYDLIITIQGDFDLAGILIRETEETPVLLEEDRKINDYLLQLQNAVINTLQDLSMVDLFERKNKPDRQAADFLLESALQSRLESHVKP